MRNLPEPSCSQPGCITSPPCCLQNVTSITQQSHMCKHCLSKHNNLPDNDDDSASLPCQNVDHYPHQPIQVLNVPASPIYPHFMQSHLDQRLPLHLPPSQRSSFLHAAHLSMSSKPLEEMPPATLMSAPTPTSFNSTQVLVAHKAMLRVQPQGLDLQTSKTFIQGV